MTEHHDPTASPSHREPAQLALEAPPKAPVAGIVAGVALLLGLGGWTAARVTTATQEKRAVAEQRAEDAARQKSLASAPKRVEVVLPSPSEWVPTVEIDGTLVAARSAEIGFEAPGRIARLGAGVGDQVRAGALLATLDTAEAAARANAAEAGLRAAEAALTLATDADQRTAKMVASGSVAEAAGVETSQQRSLALARLDAARAELALSSVALKNHRLTAPFAGTVIRAPDGPGSVAAPGAVLFEIADLSRLTLRGTLGEHDAALVEPGSKLGIDTEKGPVEGTVRVVLGSVDPATRRVRVEADVDNADGRLRAGSFVRAEVRGAAPTRVLELPQGVLRPGAQDELFVVQGEALRSRRVVYSVGPKGEILVRRGLEAGERVVRSPAPDARDGETVSVEGGASGTVGRR